MPSQLIFLRRFGGPEPRSCTLKPLGAATYINGLRKWTEDQLSGDNRTGETVPEPTRYKLKRLLRLRFTAEHGSRPFTGTGNGFTQDG